VDHEQVVGTSAMGQIRPFALAEPHASFTLTNRHSRRQSSRRNRTDAVYVRSLSALLEKIADGRVAIAHQGPKRRSDGRWSLNRFDQKIVFTRAQQICERLSPSGTAVISNLAD
jgi:hypothetical protein